MAPSLKFAVRLSLSYAVVAVAYILVSSGLAARFASNIIELEGFEQFKGMAFVATTALLVFIASLRGYRRVEAMSGALLERERMLFANERKIFAGVMASTVAHDANNLLTVLMADLGELKEDPATAPETLQRLTATAARLVEINRKLTASQASTSRAATTTKALELSTMVSETLAFCRNHPSLSGKQLSVNCTPALTRAQPMLVTQMVTNLLLNAGEATGPHGRIDVRVRSEGGDGIIEVHDDGPGIPSERRATLFEALATTKPNGNGLGLFSVKACADSMLGKVAIEGSPLGGACFRITLPLVTGALGGPC